MRSMNISSVLLVIFLSLAATKGVWSQTEIKSNPPHLMADQTKASVMDDAISTSTVDPGTTQSETNVYTIDAEGNLVKTLVKTTANKILIKKEDYDVLSLDKKKLMMDERESYLIIE